MNDFTDSELIQRYTSGEKTAFDLLYKKYYRRLFGYCYRLLPERDAVEDIVQTVFIKAMESLHSLDKPELFYYWLFTIARNEVYSLFRSNKKNGTGEVSEEAMDPETPHDRFVQSETAVMVEEGLNKLKPEYREVLILRQYEKLSYAEIAAITGATISSVESRLFKARKALMKYLEPYIHERGVR